LHNWKSTFCIDWRFRASIQNQIELMICDAHLQ
jgi:hypothetical protein